MIDLKDLRENPEKYRRGAQLKGVAVDIDAILAKEQDRVSAQQEFERFRSEQNEASTQIGKLKAKVKEAEDRMRAVEAALQPLLLLVPQPPDDDVPPGKSEADNVVLYKHG